MRENPVRFNTQRQDNVCFAGGARLRARLIAVHHGWFAQRGGTRTIESHEAEVRRRKQQRIVFVSLVAWGWIAPLE
jgi:hypothetical protein